MAGYFTQYWAQDNCDYYAKEGQEGKLLDHTAGSLFRKQGVTRGDFIYVVTVRDGELFLIGKLEVGDMVLSDEEAEARIGYEPWSAPEHLIARAATPMRFNRKVPLEVTRTLRFASSSKGPRPPKFRETKLGRQTLRGVVGADHKGGFIGNKRTPGQNRVTPASDILEIYAKCHAL